MLSIYPRIKLITAVFVILALMNPSFAVEVLPCKVQNMFVQPQFGISAKTQELVEVIQAPPQLTQTVQVGICLNGNNSFGDVTLSNLPNFICRQRYSTVEVYSKVNNEKLNRLRSLRSILKVAKDGPVNTNREGLVKDLLLIEAGCDIFFNYPSTPTGAVRDGSPITPSMIGASEVNFMNFEASHQQPGQSYNIFRVEKPSEIKPSAVKQRSLPKNDFFRKGFYLRALNDSDEELVANNTDIKMLTVDDKLANQSTILVQSRHFNTSEWDNIVGTPDEDRTNDAVAQDMNNVTNIPLVETSTLSPEVRTSPATFEIPLGTAPQNNGTETIFDENDLDLEGIYDDEGYVQEHPLHPEDIGATVLFLDSSLDPVMRLISNVEARA